MVYLYPYTLHRKGGLMTTDLRTIIATRILQTTLPDGDVAAEMLLSADITEPVKMATPPNPARCLNLVRGGFVKAATLAMSTDDPGTLEKLARHASLGVKLAVVQNPAVNEAARRIVEVAALKRNDDEILCATLQGASFAYILEGLRNEKKRARYVRVLHGDLDVVKGALKNLEPDAALLALDELLRCDPAGLARVVGTMIGGLWPVDVNLGSLADICAAVGIETELQFLSAIVANTNHLDSSMVVIIDRILTRCEEKAPHTEVRNDARLRGAGQLATLTENGRSGLISLCSATAKLVYGIDPCGETLDQISEKHGVKAALVIALNTQDTVKPDKSARRWVAKRAYFRHEDGAIEITCDMNRVSLFIEEIDDDDILVAALQKAPRNLSVSYLSGQFGPVSEERARIVASVHPVDVLRSARHIRGKEWGKVAIESAILAAPIEDVLQSFHYLNDNISAGDLETLLTRMMGVQRDRQDAGRYSYSGMGGKPLADSISSDAFIEHMDNENLSSEMLLQWLSSAHSPQLTISYLNGTRRRKLSMSEIDEILERPGGAWGNNLTAALPRILSDLLEHLPIETVDRIVDAAGGSVLEYLRRQSDSSFSQYLVERITRSGASSGEWIIAFELFTKSPASVGAAISAAKKLGRARKIQQ